ncbi:hypothetical protein B0J11DRAFT_54948 [Dendryphion nanum]|uniref:Uncharacterized protein n=1 Tax=Dendryphion nanum TaxID=256645 RepID=A0A9P9II49_9PLEO|nr:hypothetical protein B0J11DRAFT_54948 [Dendryphion nanum]
MKTLSILALAAVTVFKVLAAPTATPQNILPPESGPLFFLRTFAPEQPWHGRHLVLLPSSRRLGLENFTVHPTTPPITFTPLQLASTSSFALALPGGSDDENQNPWLAAFKAHSSTTASFGTIVSLDPNDVKGTCPADVEECQANGFTMYQGQGGDPGLKRLSFDGFQGGAFQAVKDAPKGEGWHVYWRWTPDPVLVQIEFEVVPVTRLGEIVSEY